MDAKLTDEQKFLFDLKGWCLIPSVLTDREIEGIKGHLRALEDDPGSLPEIERSTYGGPTGALLDHPQAVAVLREVIRPDFKDEAYGFRCDSSFFTIRSAGWDHGLAPHGSNPENWRTHQYRVSQGRPYSPCTRVAWELNAVGPGDGGTLFLSGSHKSNFEIPERRLSIDDALFESYECPAGSMLFFTEYCWHAGAPWRRSERDRMAVFNHYNDFLAKIHYGGPSHETIMAMPPKRRTLFRGVWHTDFGGGPSYNVAYCEENHAI